MMGPTHALGGVAALGALSMASGHVADVPAWAYLVAAGSALIPDADNDRGSLLNRPYLLPLKAMTIPLWMGAAHRGRTHSIAGLFAYSAIVLGWGLLLNLLLAFLTGSAEASVPLAVWTAAAAAGYASHLFLDLFNIPGMLLLWPLEVRVFFPPWRAHGIVPGRFATATWWERLAVWTPMAVFCSWFFVANAAAIGAATTADGVLTRIPGALWRALIDFLRSAAG